VIADAIAAAEISVRVVVERAPTETTGELRVGGDLIVNPRVATGVLAQSIGVVGRMCRKGVLDKLVFR
jgi:hypothetical protein